MRQTKITPIQNGNISWDHLRGNLSLKKVEMVKTENAVNVMSASMISADTALRTVKPILQIPAIIPTIWCFFMREFPTDDMFLGVLKIRVSVSMNSLAPKYFGSQAIFHVSLEDGVTNSGRQRENQRSVPEC